jgi:TRAP-type transport system periplasmic protein
MKRRAVFLVAALFIMVSMVFMASSPVWAGKKVTLVYGSQTPQAAIFEAKGSIPWMERITKASNDEIQFKTYFGQSLFKGVDAWEAVKQGQTDIGLICVGFFPGVASLSEWAMLPFIPFPSGEAAGRVAWKLYEKYPEYAKQYEDLHVLHFIILQPYFWQMKNKAIRTIDDVKGAKIRVASPVQGDVIRTLGGSPVFMGINDVYPNIEKGVIDGCINPWEANTSFKLFELVNQYTMINMGSNIFVIAMNKKKWESLSPEHQKIIMENSGLEESARQSKAVCDDLVAAAKEQAETKGPNPEFFTPSPEELAKWEEAVVPTVWGKWVKDNKAKNFTNARQILDDAMEMLKAESK